MLKATIIGGILMALTRGQSTDSDLASPPLKVCNNSDMSRCVHYFTEKPPECYQGQACISLAQHELETEGNCKLSETVKQDFLNVEAFEGCSAYTPPILGECVNPDWSRCAKYFKEEPVRCVAGIACWNRFQINLAATENCFLSEAEKRLFASQGMKKHCSDVTSVKVLRIVIGFGIALMQPQEEIILGQIVCGQLAAMMENVITTDLTCLVTNVASQQSLLHEKKVNYEIDVLMKNSTAEVWLQTATEASVTKTISSLSGHLLEKAEGAGIPPPTFVGSIEVQVELPAGDADGDKDTDKAAVVATDTSMDTSLTVMGLSVGIPIGIALIAVIVFLVRRCQKQKSYIEDLKDIQVASKKSKLSAVSPKKFEKVSTIVQMHAKSIGQSSKSLNVSGADGDGLGMAEVDRKAVHKLSQSIHMVDVHDDRVSESEKKIPEI